jgi:hypothetical protein
VIRNDGRALLPAVTVRLRVLSRKGNAWTTDYVTAEGLAPGEQRAFETSVWLSERARARKGASLQVTATVCVAPVLATLSVQTPDLTSGDTTEWCDVDAASPEQLYVVVRPC